VTMKMKPMNVFRNSALCAACALFAAGTVEAKPDKEKGGGKPGHSEKQKGGGKNDNKGKSEKSGNPDKAAGKGQKNAEKAQKENRKADDKQDNAEWRKKGFRDDDRTGVIRYFSEFRDHEHGLPPGLAKNLQRGKALPPGWQKKVQGGYVIEDDLRDHFHPLEYSLFPGLEAVPDTRLYLYGSRIVRVYEPRREVIDIIEVPTIRFD
jgi:hypothetical protein